MTANERILDANRNRAREALRVIEEFARFDLQDAALTAEIKSLRHEVAALLPQSLAAARDITGDLGRSLEAENEYRRASGADTALAAANRLTEALRVLEEYAKVADPDGRTPRTIEQLRYRSYEVQRHLVITVRARENLAGVRLYVIITEALCANGDWLATAKLAIRGGADCLQLREKDLDDRRLLDRARQLADLCRRHDTLCIINDRPDIALAAGADGVHLGQDDLPVAAARRILAAHMIVGLSTHTAQQVDQGVADRPDYLAVGPMFDSATKPQAHIPGPTLLAYAARQAGLPLVAIGGIHPGNATALLDHATCTLCVCAAVIAQKDPQKAAGVLKGAADALRPPSHAGNPGKS